MIYPLVLDLAARGARVRVPVVVTCRVLGFSKQAFYAWCRNPISQRDWDDAHLINTALDIHAADPEFGYRLIADELNFNKGFSVSENRVWRLCRAQGIVSVIIKRRVSGKSAGPAVHDDLVVRDFSADRPNKKWITDISEHPTDEGKLYLCAVKDCFSRQLVGYSMDSHMQASLATAALGNAIMLRNPIGTIVHSDRGSQFRSKKYVMMLANNGLQGSMGRVGAAGDNAAMESFFALLQKNVLNRKRWATREELRLAIVIWIEATYNRRRRQRALGCLTPIEFETIHHESQVA